MDNEYRRRNLLTGANHAKDSFWQITFPLIIGILVVLALAVWTVAVAAAGDQVDQAADASLILLIIPALLIAFIFLAILSSIVYLVIWLNRNLPFYTYRLQKFFSRVEGQVVIVAEKSTRPMIKVQSLSAVLRAVFRAIGLSR